MPKYRLEGMRLVLADLEMRRNDERPMNTDVGEIARAVALIRPILARCPPAMQGAIIADLLAIWLAGHHVEGDVDATRALRAEILATHLLSIEELVTVNAKIIGTTP